MGHLPQTEMNWKQFCTYHVLTKNNKILRTFQNTGCNLERKTCHAKHANTFQKRRMAKYDLQQLNNQGFEPSQKVYEPGSKLLVLGMVIQPLVGNPYNGYINPYYWVDDHPLLYGSNGSLDPSTYICCGWPTVATQQPGHEPHEFPQFLRPKSWQWHFRNHQQTTRPRISQANRW